jgi:hypothetical protein
MKSKINLQSFKFKIDKSKITDLFDLKELKSIRSFPSSLNQNTFKLYIISVKGKIVYVGVTKRGIRTRLYTGLNANGKGGYHGYKWKIATDGKIHLVGLIDLDKDQMENIEAELVYLVRKETGSWPLFQNEIHFNNDYSKGTKIAESIYKELKAHLTK